MSSKPSLFAALARAQLQKARMERSAKEKWVPTEEEQRAIAEGSLSVIDMLGGPRIAIDLRAGADG